MKIEIERQIGDTTVYVTTVDGSKVRAIGWQWTRGPCEPELS